MIKQTVSSFLEAFFPNELESIFLRALAPKKAPRDQPGFAVKNLKVTRRELATSQNLQARLLQINKTRGLYFVVNSGGTDDKAITKFNAWFMEDDNRTIKEQHQRLNDAPLQPSIRVETLKSVHAYWLISDECTKDDWVNVQRQLIAYFGSDEKIKNPARVMRLPFFNHVRYDVANEQPSYHRVSLVEFFPDRRYRLEQMLAEFGAVSKLQSTLEVPTVIASQTTDKFSCWTDLNKEAGRRIRLLPKARNRDNGWTNAPGICHGSEAGTALCVSPTGAYKCLGGCDTARVLAALGLASTPDPIEQKSSEDESNDPSLNSSEVINSSIVRFSEVQPEEVDWLWPHYIALGKLTILEGEEGIGKSWLTASLASIVSTGTGFPPEYEHFEPGNVLMLSAEDGLADTIKPRLSACGADVNRVFAVNEALTLDKSGLAKLESHIIATSAKLVIIDPIFAYTPYWTDTNSANQSRAISAALARIAEKYNCAFLLVRHIGKAKGNGDPRAAGLGSIDWRASARSVLLIGKSMVNESERGLVQTKNNLAQMEGAIGFKIEGASNGAKFSWTGRSDLTSWKILAAVPDEDTRSEQLDAEDFLQEALRDGAQEVKEVIGQAAEFGISTKQLRTAREKLKVVAKKHGGGFDKENRQFWTWQLPFAKTEDAPTDTEDVK